MKCRAPIRVALALVAALALVNGHPARAQPLGEAAPRVFAAAPRSHAERRAVRLRAASEESLAGPRGVVDDAAAGPSSDTARMTAATTPASFEPPDTDDDDVTIGDTQRRTPDDPPTKSAAVLGPQLTNKLRRHARRLPRRSRPRSSSNRTTPRTYHASRDRPASSMRLQNPPTQSPRHSPRKPSDPPATLTSTTTTAAAAPNTTVPPSLRPRSDSGRRYSTRAQYAGSGRRGACGVDRIRPRARATGRSRTPGRGATTAS